MSNRSEYSEWHELEHFYLEDSYVLEIVERLTDLVFRMEFVLREGHPRYRPPAESYQYCYARGQLTFRGTADIRWSERRDVTSFDATGEPDLGNMDLLYRESGRFVASGDWGQVSFVAADIVVTLDEANGE